VDALCVLEESHQRHKTHLNRHNNSSSKSSPKATKASWKAKIGGVYAFEITVGRKLVGWIGSNWRLYR
jgi:hypothetical protein